ncbi:ABC transporter permease subunit [Nocardia sp. NPDC052112]|uniref:ABC transporter permease n=1 Tax=Nocardia sp. NPDC052112 TaxID=3155646 RepID=UPI00343D626F
MNFEWLGRQSGHIIDLVGWHVVLSVAPLVVGLIIALPIGWVAHRSRRLHPYVVGTAGLFYTVPSLALFVMMPLILGTKILDPMNVIVSLTIYTVALLVRVVADALDAVPPETVLAATAMGYRPYQTLLLVQLPIGVPVISAGLRVAVVSNVSLASLAALLGIPQVGTLFTQGFQLRFYTPIITGIVLCLLLALVLDLLVVLGNRLLTPWTPKVVAS